MSAKHFDEKGNEFNCPHDQVISDINGSLLSISKTLAGFNNRLTETYNRLFVDPEKGDCISTAVKKNTEYMKSQKDKKVITRAEKIGFYIAIAGMVMSIIYNIYQ